MEARAAQLIALLGEHHSLGNGKARQLLGWDEATYEEVKQALVASGQVAQGRGRGGSIALVGGGSVAPSHQADEPRGPIATMPMAAKAIDQDPILMQRLTATDLLRSNFAALLSH